MTLFQSLFADITFFEVAMSLLAVGLVERVVVRLPGQLSVQMAGF